MRKLIAAGVVLIACVFILLSSGCNTKQYNVRAIVDIDREYCTEDSTIYNMAWNTKSWYERHAKNWSSASVIVTNPQNVFVNNSWITRIKNDDTNPFKGTILVKINPGRVEYDWHSEPEGSYQYRHWYLLTGEPSDYPLYYSDDSGIIIYEDENVMFGDPSTFTNSSPAGWGPQLATIVKEELDELSNSYTNIKFGVLLDYDYRTWNDEEDFPSLAGDSDPFDLGKTFSNYTDSEMDSFNTFYEDIVSEFSSSGIYTVVTGDKLFYESLSTSLLADSLINGYMFENVTATNYSADIQSSYNLRDAYPDPIYPTESLMLIAATKQNAYSAQSEQKYATMVKAFVNNGMFFTPGTDDGTRYFNYPRDGLQNWWVRRDNDVRWQANPNVPQYESSKYHLPQTWLGTPTNLQLNPVVPDDPEEDTTAPEIQTFTIADLDSSGANNTIRTRLTGSSDDPSSIWTVEFSKSVGGPWTGFSLGEASQSFNYWHSTNYSPFNGFIYYRITATDSLGNVSNYTLNNVEVIRQLPDEVNPIVTSFYGIGGGGQIHANAMMPNDPTKIMLGMDNQTATFTPDFGDTFKIRHRGIAQYEIGEFDYGSDVIGINNSYFEGFIITTFGGVFKTSLASTVWDAMTPGEDGYWYSYGTGTKDALIPWNSVEWDGNDFVVLGAGKVRFGSESAGTYQGSVYPDGTSYTQNDCPLGDYSVWRYDFSDDIPSVEPFYQFGEIGDVHDIDVEVISGDTIVVAATYEGLYYYDSSTGNVTNISGKDVNNSNETYTGTFSINGHTDHLFTSVELTSRGVLYVGVENRNRSILPSSGIYKVHDIQTSSDDFEWCGDGTNIDVINISAWEYGCGSNTPTVDYDAVLTYITVDEGTGAEADTLYCVIRYDYGDNTAGNVQIGLMKAASPYERTYQQESWDPKFWNNYGLATDGVSIEGGTGWADLASWGAETTVPALVQDYGDSTYVTFHANGMYFTSVDGGENWKNVYTTELDGQDYYYRSNGYSQSIVGQAANATETFDNRLMISQADHGLKITNDENWDYFRPMQSYGLASSFPDEYLALVTWQPMTADSSGTTILRRNDGGTYDLPMTIGECWAIAGGPIVKATNWNGTGRDALIAATGDIIGFDGAGRIHVYFDEDDDGTWEWESSEPTAEYILPQKFTHDAMYWDDENRVLWVASRFWGPWEDAGDVNYVYSRTVTPTLNVVSYLTYDDNNGWDGPYHVWDGLPTDEYISPIKPTGITKIGDYVFVSIDLIFGGVWYYDTNDGASGSWTKVVGGTGNNISQRDITSLAKDGSTLWAGSSGYLNYGGDGGLYVCPDAANHPDVWVQVSNLDNNTLALDGLDSPGYVLQQRFGTDELVLNRRMTSIPSIYIDSNDMLWYGAEGNGGIQNPPWAGPYLWYENSGLQVGSIQLNESPVSVLSVLTMEEQTATSDNFMYLGFNPGMGKISLDNLYGYISLPSSRIDTLQIDSYTVNGTVTVNFSGETTESGSTIYYSHKWDDEENWSTEESYSVSGTSFNVSYDTGNAIPPGGDEIIVRVKVVGSNGVECRYYYAVEDVVISAPEITSFSSIDYDFNGTNDNLRVRVNAETSKDCTFQIGDALTYLGPYKNNALSGTGSTLDEWYETARTVTFDGTLYLRLFATAQDGSGSDYAYTSQVVVQDSTPPDPVSSFTITNNSDGYIP